MSALVQVLYWLPDVRRIIVQESCENDLAHATLASLFARMMDSVEGEPQEMDVDFFAAVERLTSGSGQKNFTPGATDDAHSFLTWLVTKNLPKVASSGLFNIKLSSHFEYNGIPLTEQTTDETAIMGKVFEHPDGFIDESLNIEEEIDFTVDPGEYYDKYNREIFGGQSIASVLIENGVVEAKKLKVTNNLRVTNTPGILVINASKFQNDNSWVGTIPTNYRRTFDLNGQTYHLYSMIVYQPAHYVARVCVDPVSDTWYEVSDSVSRQIDPAEVVKNTIVLPEKGDDVPVVKKYNDPYLFFYVRGDLIEKWKREEPIGLQHVDPRYKVAGQAYTALVKGVKLLSDLTGIKAPGSDWSIVDTRRTTPPKNGRRASTTKA
jgi:hypothetical protein